MTAVITPAEFLGSAPAPMNSNTAWGARFASEVIRPIIVRYADAAPRQRQTSLGPSELGVSCDRQVVGKMAGLARTNHVTDPWASIMGTAGHSWLADAFNYDNLFHNELRWLTEQKVSPHPDYPGSSDLYHVSAIDPAVIDHKLLGTRTLNQLRTEGPSMKYRIQLLLYARGFKNLGLPVKRIVIVGYPRTGSSLDGMYVWDHELVSADDDVVDEILFRTEIRRQLATEVMNEAMSIESVPRAPDDHECYFCPFYRPQSARDGGAGCPGPRGPQT